MLELKYCKAIHKLYWQQLRPGLIYLGGIQLSQGEIPELRNYPILTLDLLESLSRKYHFLKGKVLTDEELKVKKKKYFEIFTKFANSCGGNQIILNVFDFLKIITVETYDRYMGLLTIASPKEVQKIHQETFQEPFGKVKKYEFKKLSI